MKARSSRWFRLALLGMFGAGLGMAILGLALMSVPIALIVGGAVLMAIVLIEVYT